MIGLKWLREIAVLAQQIELLSQDTVDPDAPDSIPHKKWKEESVAFQPCLAQDCNHWVHVI